MLLWNDGTMRRRQNFARVRKMMIRKVNAAKILAIKVWPWMASLPQWLKYLRRNEYFPGYMGFWVMISQSLTVFL